MNRCEFENRIYNKVKDYFLKLLANTENLKVRSEIEPLGEHSEISISVYKNGDLFEVFEFFVYYNNEQNVTEKEVMDYLNEIKRIIA